MINNLNKLSFLNIEYVWSAKNQTVFFIPEKQFNEDSLQNFEKVKDNNWYLAIATNIYDVKDYNSDILTLAFYQHGYYDYLLKSNYQVIPCRRTYLGKEMPYKMSFDEFKKTFAYNKRRLKLYNDFIQCISTIKTRIKINMVKIGGSFVEGKENPNDLDLVIYISEEMFAAIKNNPKLYNQYQILTFPHLLKRYELELDVRVFIEKEIDLNNDIIYSDDEYIRHLCQRGYCASLYTNCYKTADKGYLHNFISISN